MYSYGYRGARELIVMSVNTKTKCNIVSVGKRRDGGTRFWCLEHKADATAKYGVRAKKCLMADRAEITKDEILILDIADFPGGIALWGAVPAVYDTTRQPLDRGIHVHARKIAGGDKLIDASYRQVLLSDSRKKIDPVNITELDAIYYMVSTVFHFDMVHVSCTSCGYSHLDKDWFSLHPHQRHLCAGCGKYFRDDKIGIGNPLVETQSHFGLNATSPVPAKKRLKIRQRDYPGGIQIWGSNASIFWTGDHREEYGIHVHVYEPDGVTMVEDNTFGTVEIDGLTLDAEQIRHLMAQNIIPHVQGRIVSARCGVCSAIHESVGVAAYTPAKDLSCTSCGAEVKSGSRFRSVISNPAVETLAKLSELAPRTPQVQKLDLLPETI